MSNCMLTWRKYPFAVFYMRKLCTKDFFCFWIIYLLILEWWFAAVSLKKKKKQCSYVDVSKALECVFSNIFLHKTFQFMLSNTVTMGCLYDYKKNNTSKICFLFYYLSISTESKMCMPMCNYYLVTLEWNIYLCILTLLLCVRHFVTVFFGNVFVILYMFKCLYYNR